MSLIHVSSQGDKGGSATRFSNFFPNPIIIEPNSQVALVNIILSPNGNVLIDDTNNVLYFAIGALSASTQGASQNRVVIAEGEYTAAELAVLLTDGLNAMTFQAPYYKFASPTGGGWLVSLNTDSTTGKPVSYEFKNTQNDQPAITAWAGRAGWTTSGSATFAADQVEFESLDAYTSTATGAAGTRVAANYFGVSKANVAAND